MIKPTKVLCKRSYGKEHAHWWEDEGSAEPPNFPKRHEYDDRDLVEGEWYDVVENEHDSWDTEKEKYTFSIINNKGNRELHYMYTDEQRLNFPDHCDVYGPRDYAKWFYTPEELLEVEAGTYKMSYKEKNDITVKPGNYHWVKYGENWVIAQAVDKYTIQGKHYWNVMGTDRIMSDFNFEEIGEQVHSMNKQIKNEKTIQRLEELNEAIFPMLDSWFAEGTEDEKWRAPIEYHKQFVKEATKRNSKKMWESLVDSPFFGKKENL